MSQGGFNSPGVYGQQQQGINSGYSPLAQPQSFNKAFGYGGPSGLPTYSGAGYGATGGGRSLGIPGGTPGPVGGHPMGIPGGAPGPTTGYSPLGIANYGGGDVAMGQKQLDNSQVNPPGAGFGAPGAIGAAPPAGGQPPPWSGGFVNPGVMGGGMSGLPNYGGAGTGANIANYGGGDVAMGQKQLDGSGVNFTGGGFGPPAQQGMRPPAGGAPPPWAGGFVNPGYRWWR